MTSPAERYAASRRRAAEEARHPALTDFVADLDFALDPFQMRGLRGPRSRRRRARLRADRCRQDRRGRVRGPPGPARRPAGARRKCFYTTPIKALSNQKFHDLVERYGADQVGLLTGDNAINGDAPVVVMTTEVLRNMLYAGSSTLDGLGYVVMDEVHYLADRFRGAVWEEVIIHLPASRSRWSRCRPRSATPRSSPTG